jgi:amidase
MAKEPVADLVDLPATELARRVRTGELSPVELIEATLARVDIVNPHLNAIVTLNERALDDARALEALIARGEDPGPLAGLPVGIKDVTPVAGLRTTYGSPLYRNHVPMHDAVVVQRLRAAGAIILGKTNCPEFAAGGNTWNDVFGRTRNPWNPALSAGGSTGGGAVALATGMIAIAEGTDLGGSLRIPASFCGIVGIRPTVGVVPTWPSEWAWDTLQVTGPMGRTAADVMLALDAMAGASPYAPYGPVAHPGATPREKEAIFAKYCPDIAGITIDPMIEAVCSDAVDALEGDGASIEEIEFDLSWSREPFLALRGHWFVTMMLPRLDRIDEFGVNVRNNTRSGLEVSMYDLARAEAARGRMWDQFRRLFDTTDVLLTPTMAVPPFPVEQNYPDTIAGRPMETYIDWLAPTFVLSMSGLPVASVPCGLDPNGLPVGMQVVGRPHEEARVLAVAHRIQSLCPIGLPSLDFR